jgi:hypothetical protein
MNDAKLIEKIAELWIELGGDAEGVEYCWKMLRDRVKEITDFDNNEAQLTKIH